MGDGEQENRSGSEQSRGSNGKEGRKRESEGTHGKRAEGDREYSGEEAMGRPEGFVYFVETHDSAFVKIGYSVDALRRFHQLQVPGARLLGVMPGTRVTEGWLHRKFAELRGDGEWFRHGVQIREFIGAVGLMKPEPPTLKQKPEPEPQPEPKEKAQQEPVLIELPILHWTCGDCGKTGSVAWMSMKQKKKNAVAQAMVAMRNNKLSPERRKEIASKAAKKRWGGAAKP